MFNLKQALTGPDGDKNPLSEVKSMLFELTQGKVKKSAELDVTKARLVKEIQSAQFGEIAKGQRDELRATPEQTRILANIMQKVENDFIESDLKRDLGITDPEKLNEYRMLFREYFTTKMSNEMLLEIYASKEWERLNMHVNEVSKYTQLDQIIATCKVEGNTGAWKVFAEKHPTLATAGAWLISWYVGNKDVKDMSSFDKKLMSIGSILSGEEPKPDPNAPATTAPATTGKPEVAVKPEDLNEKQKATIKPLTDVDFIIDLNTLEADIKYLNEQHLDNDQIVKLAEAGATSNGKFYKIGKAIMTKLGGKPMKFRLSDVQTIEGLSDEGISGGQIGAVLKLIEKVDANPTKMREALNRTRQIKSNDSDDTIARHLQIKPDELTSEAASNKGGEMG